MSREIRDIRVVFLVFSLIFSVSGYRLYSNIYSYIFFAAALLLLILLSFTPLTLKPLFVLWIRVAGIIGKINTVILLTLFFVVAFVPVGVFMRARGKDPLDKSFADDETYWNHCQLSGLKDQRRYERQF